MPAGFIPAGFLTYRFNGKLLDLHIHQAPRNDVRPVMGKSIFTIQIE